MDNNYYSPNPTAPPSKRHTVNFMSPSPPMTPQDWEKAANLNLRSRKETPHTPHKYDTYSRPIPIDSSLLGARRPGQSASYGRDIAWVLPSKSSSLHQNPLLTFVHSNMLRNLLCDLFRHLHQNSLHADESVSVHHS